MTHRHIVLAVTSGTLAAACANPDAQCSGQPDFTPCAGASALRYNICIDEVCRAPGCGDATCNAPAPHFALPDTSQTRCYDDAGEIACPALPCTPGKPFCGQDAQYGWDAAHAGARRFLRDTTVAGQPVVTDGITGLMWQGCTLGWMGDHCEIRTDVSEMWKDWADSVAICDSLDWAGHHDWHLPDNFELLSHADYQAMGVDPVAFPNTDPDYFRASTTRWADDHLSWDLFMGQGYLNAEATKLGLYYSRCVRGGEAVTRTLAVSRDAGAAVVTDPVTHLVWQGCVVGVGGEQCDQGGPQRLSWQAALATCEALSLAGFDDWRVPNIFELHSIVKTTVENPSIDGIAFPNTPVGWAWSSTTWPDLPAEVFGVEFGYGAISYVDKDPSEPSYVRCVRDLR